MKLRTGAMSVDQLVYAGVLGACGIAALAQDFTNWVGYFALCLALLASFWHRIRS